MPDFFRHSPVAQVAYHDLVSMLLDDAFSDMRGSPTIRKLNGRSYWYDRYRIGNETHERYLGEDTAETRERVDQHMALKASQANRQRERARLVRLLRGERFLGMDGATGSLVAALARVGAFRLGGVLVGTNAFRLYEGELGLRLGFDQLAMTNDIDIASFERLSFAISDSVLPSIDEALRELDFEPAPSLEPEKIWRWRQTSNQTFVEFLTPSFTEQEGIRDLPALGVSAQSLHFLNYLIAEPIPAAAVYREGVLVRIPRPEKFAVHKLIVADRRPAGPDSLKARKDLAQSELLMKVLAEDRPGDLIEAYQDARSRGSQWRQRLDRSLSRIPHVQEYLQ